LNAEVGPGLTTLLVEDLQLLARALPVGSRYPALERVLARGKQRQVLSPSPNHLRYQLFSANSSRQLSVAALTRADDCGVLPEAGSYWLRADPVTMRADRTQVFTTSCGFADLDQAERDEINRIVVAAMQHEGISTPDCQNGHWCFALDAPLDFEFMPLHQALGLDVAEALPSSREAIPWKRLLTEIQVDLHQSEVNVRRRAGGLQEINSVWFWGGGTLPAIEEIVFDSVFSNDPVSRGLAMASGSHLARQHQFTRQRGTVLVDWVMASADAVREAGALERFVQSLLSAPMGPGEGLTLLDGSGNAWALERSSRWRFWKGNRPLATALRGEPRS
jgi:hypothetical protein